jgi:hypothetical protein
MASNYSRTSPYRDTPYYGQHLDIMVPRPIPAQPDDIVYTIDKAYHLRPDLLAFDLYQDAALWWVFQMRNPNVISDPLGDFTSGTSIRIPKQATLNTALGL